ncbi:acetate/propionate family kinase [Comamonadaceae bacterium OH3737_COT-264]|nr:acetate/propionate family kinase [Comamonadaceae bacterium OH3737_COT-264]
MAVNGDWSDCGFLVLNAGSSSLKVALFAATGDEALLSGKVEKIGQDGVIQLKDAQGQALPVAEGVAEGDLGTHTGALMVVIRTIQRHFPALRLAAVGHRIVHGGPQFNAPLVITPDVMQTLEALAPFAPLHQPHNLAGVRAAMAAFPGVPQVACFDTAFHRDQPFVNDTFGLPSRYYEQGVRRYGFHGLSYEYITGQMRQLAPQLAAGRVVVAHLGNGASMCAVHDGRAVACSMGFSPLDGLAMGTRCGQIDPGVLLYMLDQEKLSSAEIARVLYHESGLLGLSDLSNDMRTLEAAGTPQAQRAIDYFVMRAQRELGALAAQLGGLDALVFSGGIGENSVLIRARICERLGWMGIELDPARNAEHATWISAEQARTAVLVVRTHEELVIARSVRAVVGMA